MRTRPELPTRTETLAPPSDVALEAAVLGAMLLERDAVATGLSLLRPGAAVFYPDRHQLVFRAIEALHAAGHGIDVLTVTDQVRRAGHLDRAGGAVAIAGLMVRADSAAHLADHCQALLELYTKRRIADVARLLLAKAYDPIHDPHDLLAEAQAAITALHAELESRSYQRVGDVYDRVVDKIVAATQAPSGLTGTPSGLVVLDRVTGGWQPGNLIIVAGRPGMGKTSFMIAMARNAAGLGSAGLFVSLEMSILELVTKLMATELGYTTNQLTKGGRLTADEAEGIRLRAAELRRIGLYIDDSPTVGLGELRAKATKAQQEHGIKWLMVDYLQLVSGEGKGKGNREQEISSISRALKLIAKELNIPVIAAAQLSRAVESRGGEKKPQLSDLRESGAIEQDADLVVFPHRPEYYGAKEDAEGNPTADLTEIIIAKHRNVPTVTGDEALVVYSNMATGQYRDRPQDAPFEVLDGAVGPRLVSLGSLPKSNFNDDDETNLPF